MTTLVRSAVHATSCAASANRFTGGKKILQRVAGKDASKQFWKYHNEGILKKYQAKLQVGSLDSKPKAAQPDAAAAAPMPTKKAEKKVIAKTEESEPLDPFGDMIPYADPAWYHAVSRLPEFYMACSD